MSTERQTEPKAVSSFFTIMKYAKPYKIAFIFSVLLLSADIVYDVGYAWVQQLFIDAAGRRDLDKLLFLTGASFAAGIGIILFFMLQFYLRNSVQSWMQRDFSTDVFRQIVSLPYSSLIRFHSGDLVSRTTRDVQQSNGMVANIVYELTYNVALFAVAFAYLATMNWKLALLVVLSAPIVFAIGRWFDRKLRTYGNRLQQKDAEIRGFLQEMLQGLHIVRIFQMESSLLAKYEEKRQEQNRLHVSNMLQRTSMNQTVYLTNQLVMILCVYFTAYTAIQGSLTAGQVLAFLVLISRVQNPLLSVINTWGNLQQGLGAAERIFSLFKPSEERRQKGQGQPEQKDSQETEESINILQQETVSSDEVEKESGKPLVVLKEATVSLELNEEEKNVLLDGVNLTVNRGEFIAIVGPSGAGKSTMLRLCSGLISPTTGGAMILDTQLNAHPDVTEKLQKLSYVPQTPYLFTGTLKENIQLGLEEASEEDIIWAAKAAGAHSFITKLDGGYDALVGERGETLSGGQRQRITLARALIRRPKLLLLDEATSALDTLTEAQVLKSILQAMPDITVIAVTHRASAVQYASRVIAMKKGQIVEDGTHAELLQLEGIYNALFAHTEEDYTGKQLAR
ncbi:ABC transporter ATP-binding protein [Paenibacillus sp. TC-CSREp1]|uniref:ABC transporter ATP-binding protein n=1 Tax=Paenibacillus sp. TC-CSREp1 TaxID=3410089 RepID=UPI003CFDCD4A